MLAKVNPDLCYVLNGGGAKGCMELGSMVALDEAGIKPKAIYGTSVGALNSFGYRYMGLDKLKDVWFSIRKKSDILKFNWNTLMLKSKGIYNLKPLEKMMLKNSSKDVVVNNIESIVTRVSLRTGDLEYCSSRYYGYSDFVNCVIGSSSIPGLMEPSLGEFVDGGCRDISPISQAVQDGFKSIIVIETNPREVPIYKPSNFISNAYRAIDGILEHEILMNDLNNCEAKHSKVSFMNIYPENLVIDTLEFNKDKIRAGYAQGYALGKKLLEKGSM